MKKLFLAAIPLIAFASCSVNINGFNIEKDADFNLSDSRTETVQIETDNIEKLNVDIDVGQCSVKFGESDNAEIVGTYKCSGVDKNKVSEALKDIKLKYEIRNDTLYISFNDYKNFALISRITDLEITLPKSFCDFDISTDVGDIKLNELSGSFDIYADVGTVTAKNIALNGDSRIKSDVGDIDVSIADAAECKFEISADVGDVDFDTQGIDYTEKDVSKDTVSEKYELIIGQKCQAELSADVGDITIRK